MPTKPDDDESLESILNEFDAKLKYHRATTERQAAQSQRQTQHCLVTLGDVVLPTLQKFAKDLQARGHKATVNDRRSGSTSPNIDLTFTPKDIGVGESKLGFICEEGAHLQTHQVIIDFEGNDIFRAIQDIARQKADNPVTPQWVSATATNFVKVVVNSSFPE